MSANNSTNGKPVQAVAYWRMSSDLQEKSIPQQQTEMRPKARLADIEIIKDFEDYGVSGGGMKKRDAFLEMVTYCEEQSRQGYPIAAVVCYDTARFSRATSIKTARYIDQLMEAGVYRLFTWERWFDFRREEDRAIFNLQQDFSNNRFLRDHSRRVTRGKKDNALSSYFNGGIVPYAFDRLLVDEHDNPIQRIRRGEKIKFKAKGWNVVLVPTEDPEEIEVVRWLFHQYAYTETNFRALAAALTQKAIPGPGSNTARHPGVSKWGVCTIRAILRNPHYAGDYRYGHRAVGIYHRFIRGEVRETEWAGKREINPDAILHRGAHEGLVDRRTWELVQEKITARAREGLRPRTSTYVLSGGLTRCGHCGFKMQGCRRLHHGKRGTVNRRYLVCSGNYSKPGFCQNFTIREDKLLPFLIRQLQDVYLVPERLEGLKVKLRERLMLRLSRVPERAEKLRDRLTELDADILTARRRTVQVKDDMTFVELNEALRELMEQRRLLQAQLDAAARAQDLSAAELAQKVDAAIDRLYTLRDRLQEAKPENLRAVLRLLVNRIDLYFEDGPRQKKQWFRFVKGVVKLRPQLDLAGCVVNEV
jgi:DNA invertase Pin-like site-specific DNA recombinase